MTTLILAAVLQPGVIAYEPNLRRYTDGDRWVYTLQGNQLPLHTYAVDLVFHKELSDQNIFEARQTAPRGGNAADKNYNSFVLFTQMKQSGNAHFLDIAGDNKRLVQNRFKDTIAQGASAKLGALIHPGRWDDKPKPASSTSFATTPGESPPAPFLYIGKENVETDFATIECAVFEVKLPNGDYMRYWFNPRIGNYVRSETYLAKHKQTTIAYLKETNILSK